MSWFVTAGTTKYELKDGGWIEIKDQLSYGEREKLSNGAMTRVSGIGKETAGIDLDMAAFSVLKLTTWLVAWSVPEKITKAAIEALTPAIADEMEELINAHQEGLEAEKNG